MAHHRRKSRAEQILELVFEGHEEAKESKVDEDLESLLVKKLEKEINELKKKLEDKDPPSQTSVLGSKTRKCAMGVAVLLLALREVLGYLL